MTKGRDVSIRPLVFNMRRSAALDTVYAIPVWWRRHAWSGPTIGSQTQDAFATAARAEVWTST